MSAWSLVSGWVMIGYGELGSGLMVSPGIVAVAFLAATVEVVETATVLLALGVSRGWRSVRMGAAFGLVLLAVLVLVASPVLSMVPIAVLRAVVGSFALLFGLSWLRKAALRSSGRKRLRDENAVFERVVADSSSETPVPALDRPTVVLAGKAVVLEGLEVVLVVLAVGGGSGAPGSAALGAAFAVVAVALVAARLQRPLSRVPENTIKAVVGVLLVTFGIFWVGEGLGFAWPGDDAALIAIFLLVGLLYRGTVMVLRRAKNLDWS